MDWLSAYRAFVDCYQKLLIFKIDGISEFTIEGTQDEHEIPIKSTMKATRLLKQGCQGFLATLLNRDRAPAKIEDMPVVKEYPKVFPEDLSGLPADREVEIAIDVLPGTTPYLRPIQDGPNENEGAQSRIMRVIG